MKMIEAPKITSADSPRAVIDAMNATRRADAMKTGRKLPPVFAEDYPISGGWGYSLADACIIEMKGKMSDRSIPPWERDGYSVERLFVERRIYEEVIFRPAVGTPDLENLRWKLLSQRLISNNGRHYDCLRFRVTGFLHDDLEFLKADYNACRDRDDEAGMARNLKMAEEKTIGYETEYWFDIESFFG